MTLSLQLNKRITIQQRSEVRDEYGQPSEAWSDVATVWAAVTDISGRQYFQAQAERNSVQTMIMIRYRAGILPSMRVICGADVYNIESVLGQDRRTLLLMASRGVNNG